MTLRVLKKRSEYLAVASHRKKWVTPAFILLVAPDRSQDQKSLSDQDSLIGYGLTASKKMVGNAVQRNRAKRRLRALVRDVMSHGAQINMNYVFIARKNILTISYNDLAQDLEKSLKRMKLWRAKA